MRKILLLGLVIAFTSGCGRGWLPLFRGARCNGNACPAPALPAAYDTGCLNCGQGAGYGAYDRGDEGFALGGDEYYDGSVIVGGNYPGSPTVTTPMAPLPQPAPAP